MSKTLISIIFILLFVGFTEGQSNQVKRELVEQMIINGDVSRSCVSDEGGALQFLDVTLLHLDNDKLPEYLVAGKGCGCEGSVRCASSIYQKTAKGYRKLYGSNPNEDIEVLNTRTKGYRNLRGTLIMGSQTHRAIFKFNGARYK